MATILNKDLIRESKIKIKDKALIITLKGDQSLELKIKGMRGSGYTITFSDLWEYLGGKGSGGIKRQLGDNKLISLYDLRSHNAISTLGINDKSKFDQIISDMLRDMK